jgi:similar to spore coat protein
MNDKEFALHETMEVHELLTFKNVCMTKSMTMQALVSDERLNSLLQTCTATDRQHIEDLQGLLSHVNIMMDHQGAVKG